MQNNTSFNWSTKGLYVEIWIKQKGSVWELFSQIWSIVVTILKKIEFNLYSRSHKSLHVTLIYNESEITPWKNKF